MKKKRGAQPKNNNALKHGLYSAAYKAGRHRLLDKMSIMDLSAEIDLIRVSNERYLESLKTNPQPLDPETQLSAIRALSLSARAITSLLRFQAQALAANKESDELYDELMTPREEKEKLYNTPK